MKFTRREFMKRAAITGAGVALLPRIAWPFNQSPVGITKFVTPLTGLGGTGIEVLTPNTTMYKGTDYYEIVARQFTKTIYDYTPPGGSRLTLTPTFWGYAGVNTPVANQSYLGGVIVAKTGRPVKIKAYNKLPPTHILPVDPSSSTAEGGGRVDRMAIHLHGGLVQWTSDGGPFAWYSNPANGGFVKGSSFLNGAGDGAAIYDYPNEQSARLLWYHDHAYGITRLNAYAGVATGYIITDTAEVPLIASGVLPNPLGGLYTYGIPLIIQDKGFVDQKAIDEGYSGVNSVGSLWYPWKYESPGTGQNLPSMLLTDPGLCTSGTGRWDSGLDSSNNPIQPPQPSLVAEAFFDTILVNGAPYPTITLPPGRYRFRLLNGSQARFYNVQAFVHDGTADGITLGTNGTDVDPNGNPILAPTNADGPAFIQIGTEGGFLPAPVVFNTGGTKNVNSNRPMGFDLTGTLDTNPTWGNANRYNLLLAPAERADIIMDFRGFEGKKIVLYNDAPAPFPGGDIRNDYYTGRPDLTCIGGAPQNAAGQGPDTRILMQFNISGSAKKDSINFVEQIKLLQLALPVVFKTTQPPPLNPSARGVTTHVKTLNEDHDEFGRLRQLLGTLAGPTPLTATPTEVAQRGTVQVWHIFNTTADTHPMHFHLVDVQVLSRQAFGLNPDSSFGLVGVARGPDANELGWKETVRMNPSEVTTVIMKFDLPKGPLPPFSQRLQSSYGINGFEYVWHCHILEHEEHDMMHALVVT